MTATDGNNLTSTATKTVTVSAQQTTGPTAALSVSPASGTAPVQVTADASGSTAGSAPISSYTFDFGDGTTAGPQSGATATHTYQSAGSYTVTVTATDGNNLTSKAAKTVTVSAQNTSPAQYVNQIATNYSTAPHTSGSVTVWRTNGVAAGDLIIATVELTGTSATGAVTGTDTQGNTLTVASDISDGNGNRLVTLSGLANHALAVNDKITVTFPAASTYRVIADEVSGVSTVEQAVRGQRDRQRVLLRGHGHDRPGRRVRVRGNRDLRRHVTHLEHRVDRPGELQRQHEHARARVPDSRGPRQLHRQWHRQRNLAG